MAGPESEGSPDAAISLRDGLLVGQKAFRILAAEVTGLVIDTFTPRSIAGDEDYGKGIGDRMELRMQAGKASLNRYILEKNIGSQAFRDQIEAGFVADALNRSQ